MIHIYLRDTDKNKANLQRPLWFSYERCFDNLISSLATAAPLISLNVMFDGEKLPEYYNKHKDSIPPIHVHKIKAGNDFRSSQMTFEKIKEDSSKFGKNDLIYILENDYLHLPFWPSHLMYLYEIIGKGYASLFDHPDKYMFMIPDRDDHWGMYKNLMSKIIATKSRHWRSVPSTCGTFIVDAETFQEDYDILSLPKADNTRFGMIKEKRGNFCVWTPIPTLSTHCQDPFVAPYVDWSKV